MSAATVEETVTQLAMFQQRLDATEHGIVQDGVAHPTWDELGPLDGQAGYLRDARLIVEAMQRLGWSPTPTEPSVDEWSAAMDEERQRQIEHGYDDAHDQQHGARHLLNWAIDYARRGKGLAAATMIREAMDLPPREEQWEYSVGYQAVDGQWFSLNNDWYGIREVAEFELSEYSHDPVIVLLHRQKAGRPAPVQVGGEQS